MSAMTLNAGNRSELARAIRETGTTILLNAALPTTNLVVMRACLDGGCDYIDMASGGAALDGTPKLPDQFALDQEFKAAGRLAILGMGADPGTSNVYAAYAAKHLLDTVTELRVRDGDNSICQGHDGFLAAFSPWVFIDECLCGAISWRDGTYHLEEPLSGFEPFNFPELGVLNTYYVDHEESRTLPMFFPGLAVADFKLCMDDVTWQTLRVLKQMGLSRTDKVRVGDTAVSPRDVVVALLPQPGDLAGRMRGKTCVGTLARGIRNGEERSLLHLQCDRPREGLQRVGSTGHGISDRCPSGDRGRVDSEWSVERGRASCPPSSSIRIRSWPGSARWECPGMCGTRKPGRSTRSKWISKSR